jgi:hypothetical protein
LRKPIAEPTAARDTVQVGELEALRIQVKRLEADLLAANIQLAGVNLERARADVLAQVGETAKALGLDPETYALDLASRTFKRKA